MSKTEIRKLRDRTPFNQKEAAERLGLKRSTYAKYESGDRTPDYKTMDKIRRVLKKEAAGIDNDSSNGHITSEPSSPMLHEEGRETSQSLTALFQEDIQLDVFTEVRVEGGDGRVVYPDEARRKVTVPRSLISKLLGFIPPKKVGIMFAEGDSMHSTIQDGDMVIWKPVTEISDSGIYVIRVDEKLRVKRVDPIPGGGVKLISDNNYHGYPDYTLTPKNGSLVNEQTGRHVSLQAIGKVLWPDRETDRLYMKQVTQIVQSVAGGEVDLAGMAK